MKIANACDGPCATDDQLAIVDHLVYKLALLLFRTLQLLLTVDTEVYGYNVILSLKQWVRT